MSSQRISFWLDKNQLRKYNNWIYYDIYHLYLRYKENRGLMESLIWLETDLNLLINYLKENMR